MTLLEPRTVPTTVPRPVGPPPATGPIDPEMRADIDKFVEMLERNRSGELSDEVFRVFRLNNGIYGQRQGGTNQMVRVKVPYGSIQPEQLEMIGWLVDNYSRGWGHITTRQNIQFHYVQLDRIPEVLQHLASVGLTTREACGDTVRNVQGCPPGRGLPPTRTSTSRPGPRLPTGTSCATRSASACPASSRSTSRAARRTAARRCSTTWG